MPEQLLFLTGSLARVQLERVLAQLDKPSFSYQVHALPLKVAGLMTADMIRRRLPETFGADRIVVPGRCRGDLEALSSTLGVTVQRGPEELKDLPEFFGHDSAKPDLSRYRVRMFAEIVDAPEISASAVLERALQYRSWGADVIDLGCLPDTPFPHLEECIALLKRHQIPVSVDSLERDELLRGGRAGADYLLSLSEDTIELVNEVPSTPVLIPARHGDLDSLDRAIERLRSLGRAFIVDPIVDPIHFGFTDSVVRFHEVRRRHPDIDMMMGIGNITELTDTDTAGMNTLLLGMCSELGIDNVLTTQVSAHARSVVREIDRARRMMYAAAERTSLPRGLTRELMQMHERAPFPYSQAEIREFADQVRDPSFRIQISEAGIHVYNRDGMRTDKDPFAFFPSLGVDDDGSHAFYLGVELGRAQIAWQLGKRYSQDQPLHWGYAAELPEGSGRDAADDSRDDAS